MRDNREKTESILAVRAYIEAHLTETLEPKGLADRCDLAYSTFRKHFEETVGLPVYRYIRFRRVCRGARLLREGMRTADAAEACGFETLSGFFKAFRKLYGASLTDYAQSRGGCLFPEPERVTREDFCLVGCVWAMDPSPDRELLPIPFAAERETCRRCLTGAPSAACRISWNGCAYYLLGRPGELPRELPEGKVGQLILGGEYLRFRVPEAASPLLLAEYLCAVRYHALCRYLPSSPWARDSRRLCWESLSGGEAWLYVPVTPAPETAAFQNTPPGAKKPE